MRLYGFELDPSEAGFEDRPEITCSNPRRQSRGGRHVVHSSPIADGDVVVRRGIPMTSPGRTLRDVAGIVPPPTLDRFLGHLLATRDIVPAQLRQHLDASGRSVPGAPELRAAMERAGMTVAPDSVLEHRATVLLRAAGLPEASPHFPIHAEGRLVGIVDFAWPADRVVLEVDGYRWHADPRTFAGDRRRDNRSRELGWAVYRTTSAELGAGAGPLLRQLGQALGRSHRPAAPEPAV
jgi:hypothetical protein